MALPLPQPPTIITIYTVLSPCRLLPPEQNDCCICFRTYGVPEKDDPGREPPCFALELACKHYVGHRCFERMINSGRTMKCPICRHVIGTFWRNNPINLVLKHTVGGIALPPRVGGPPVTLRLERLWRKFNLVIRDSSKWYRLGAEIKRVTGCECDFSLLCRMFAELQRVTRDLFRKVAWMNVFLAIFFWYKSKKQIYDKPFPELYEFARFFGHEAEATSRLWAICLDLFLAGLAMYFDSRLGRNLKDGWLEALLTSVGMGLIYRALTLVLCLPNGLAGGVYLLWACCLVWKLVWECDRGLEFPLERLDDEYSMSG